MVRSDSGWSAVVSDRSDSSSDSSSDSVSSRRIRTCTRCFSGMSATNLAAPPAKGGGGGGYRNDRPHAGHDSKRRNGIRWASRHEERKTTLPDSQTEAKHFELCSPCVSTRFATTVNHGVRNVRAERFRRHSRLMPKQQDSPQRQPATSCPRLTKCCGLSSQRPSTPPPAVVADWDRCRYTYTCLIVFVHGRRSYL